jgi:hypothetical protein
MREAVKMVKAKVSSLALLEDRDTLGQGMRYKLRKLTWLWQTQKNISFSPLEDAINVDKRRAEVGLGKLKTTFQTEEWHGAPKST